MINEVNPFRTKLTQASARMICRGFRVLAGVVGTTVLAGCAAMVPPTALYIPQGHHGPIALMAVSRDGRLAVTSGGNHSLKVWDLTTGSDIQTIDMQTNPVTALTCTSDGLFIIGHQNGRVAAWDPRRGQWPERIKPLSDDAMVATEHHKSRPVRFVAAVGDGPYIVAGFAGGLTRVFDSQTTETRPIATPYGSVAPATYAVSPGGAFVIRSADLLETWEPVSDRPQKPIPLEETYHLSLRAVAVSPDGHRAVSYSAVTGYLAVWHLDQAERGFRYRYQGAPIEVIRYSDDGKRLACVHDDGSLSFWVAGTLAARWQTQPASPGAVQVAFLSGGEQLLVGLSDGTLELRDSLTGERVRSIQGPAVPIGRLAMSADGTVLAAGSAAGTIALWRLDPIGVEQSLPLHSAPVRALALSAENRVLASTGDDQSVIVRDLPEEANRIAWARGGGAAAIVALSPDGGHFFLADHRHRILQWNSATHIIDRTFYGHTDIVTDMAVSSDGEYLLSGARNGSVLLDRVDDGHRMWRFDIPDGGTVRVALSRTHAAAAGDHELYLLALETGLMTVEIRLRNTEIRALTFSADGDRIVVGDSGGVIRCYSTDTGRRVEALAGHAGAVTALAMDPLSDQLYSAGMDRTVRLWNSNTGVELARLLVSAQGDWIVTTPDGYFDASADGTALIRWRVIDSAATVDCQQHGETFHRPDLIRQRLARP